MNSFQELKLPEALERALQKMQFEKPTPIQAQAIPAAIEGKDLIACAQTGTGKTAAFCIPIALHLLNDPASTALVLAPTRELAQQIEVFWRQLTQFVPQMRSACLVGGSSFPMQIKALSRKPRFLIATPGRLIDHLSQRTAQLSKVSTLVLDEADRMLDMGFAPQLNQILKFLSGKKQTLLFSATWDSNLDHLVKRNLHDPVRITVGTVSSAATTVEQSTISTTPKEKNEILLDEINQREGQILVFARTQMRTERLAKFLDSFGLEVGKIHGGRTQGQRNSALASFRSGRVRVLVATDVASRGIDVTDIAHVINYDLPRVPEDYIHRIGRTGRAGSTGKALSLLTSEDRALWNGITRLLKKTGSSVPGAAPAGPRSESSEKVIEPIENSGSPDLQKKKRREFRRSEGRSNSSGYGRKNREDREFGQSSHEPREFRKSREFKGPRREGRGFGKPPREKREFREPREFGKSYEPRGDFKKPRGNRGGYPDSREPREFRGPRGEFKGPRRENREGRDFGKPPREKREFREPREFKKPRGNGGFPESREPREFKGPREFQGSRENREHRGSKGPRRGDRPAFSKKSRSATQLFVRF